MSHEMKYYCNFCGEGIKDTEVMGSSGEITEVYRGSITGTLLKIKNSNELCPACYTELREKLKSVADYISNKKGNEEVEI